MGRLIDVFEAYKRRETYVIRIGGTVAIEVASETGRKYWTTTDDPPLQAELIKQTEEIIRVLESVPDVRVSARELRAGEDRHVRFSVSSADPRALEAAMAKAGFVADKYFEPGASPFPFKVPEKQGWGQGRATLRHEKDNARFDWSGSVKPPVKARPEGPPKAARVMDFLAMHPEGLRYRDLERAWLESSGREYNPKRHHGYGSTHLPILLGKYATKRGNRYYRNDRELDIPGLYRRENPAAIPKFWGGFREALGYRLPSLLEAYGVAEAPDDGPPRLAEVFLFEDSRGNIRKFLKMGPKVADYFHEKSPKFSFALAKSYSIWLRGEQVQDFGGVNDPARVGVANQARITKALQEPEKYELERYMRELGNGVLRMLQAKPNYEKEVNKAQTIEDLRKVQSAYRKKTEIPTAKLLDKYPDGWYWIKLDAEECGEEGAIMQHCATDWRGDLVSLRDADSNPHVTMTYNAEKNRVYQIKGKQNKAPDQKYWPYIVKFWEKFRPLLSDMEFRKGSGRIGKDVSGLVKQLDAVAPPAEFFSAILSHVVELLQDPAMREWVWDIALTFPAGRVPTFEEFSELMAAIEGTFKDAGFQETAIPTTARFRNVLYHPEHWRKRVDDEVPPFEQANTWVGWTAIAMAREGLWNDRVSPDPVAWASQNAQTIQNLYSRMHKIFYPPESDEKKKQQGYATTAPAKPVSAKALIAPRGDPPVSQEQFNKWFGIYEPAQGGGEWDSFEGLVQAHPEVARGIERTLAQYKGYGRFREKYQEIMGDTVRVVRNRDVFRVWTHSLGDYILRPRRVGKNIEYYFVSSRGGEGAGHEDDA